MYYSRFAPYVSVAQRKKNAEKTIAKKIKKGEKISPVRIEGKKIANTFWGEAWCDHLESFSDYESRLPRGRSCVRHSAVIHLGIKKGSIEGMVQGSELYKVNIKITPVTKIKWEDIAKKCSGEIGSVIELLQGKLSSAVMKTITDKQQGLFPLPNEISLKCSCPDWADMCKHVAAVLYGVGARLDTMPELLFTLRNADHMELITNAAIQTGIEKPTKSKTVADQDLSALFGIDIEDNIEKPVKLKNTKNKTKKPVIPPGTLVTESKTKKSKIKAKQKKSVATKTSKKKITK